MKNIFSVEMVADYLYVHLARWKNWHKLEVLPTQMHHLPFKMHWEKMRANIHMPRSVQYPSLCFFFFSPRTLSSCYFFLLFLQQVNCNERKGSLQISLSLSLSPLFLSILHVGKMKRRRFELLSCWWLSPGTTGDSIWSTIVRLLFLGLTAPLRTGPQCSRPPVSERCSAWNMRELGSVRSGPGELCRCCCCWVRGWRRIGQTAYAHTQLRG